MEKDQRWLRDFGQLAASPELYQIILIIRHFGVEEIVSAVLTGSERKKLAHGARLIYYIAQGASMSLPELFEMPDFKRFLEKVALVCNHKELRCYLKQAESVDPEASRRYQAVHRRVLKEPQEGNA